MNIVVIGGAGYVGHKLVPSLLEDGHRLTVIDTMWFGCWLKEHRALSVVKKDIRDLIEDDLGDAEVVIHLANIANDPAVDLSPVLSWEVNVLATQRLADLAVRCGVRQIIYASSGSVYGIKTEPKVTEDLDLVPLSNYNKTKMVAERVLLSYANQMAIHNIRPATVCGLSPRMRFDVSVNMFVSQAFRNKKMTILGGSQVRPNVHIDDLVDIYRFFVDKPDLPSGPYNAGFENISILEIAKMVRRTLPSDLEIAPTNDPRSYRLDSSKLLGWGFEPRKSVQHAISEISDAMMNGLEDEEINHTVKWMKSLNL